MYINVTKYKLLVVRSMLALNIATVHASFKQACKIYKEACQGCFITWPISLGLLLASY